MAAKTLTTYDGVGRELTSTVEDQSLTAVTTTVYEGDRTTVLPPNGATATTIFVNGRGDEVELYQYKTRPTISATTGGVTGGTMVKTRSVFDGLGRKTAVTTALTTGFSEIWRFVYDQAGRVVQTTEPSAGVSKTNYLSTGEVESTQDAASRKVAYSYDKLGRPTETHAYDDGWLTRERTASWSYDAQMKGFLDSSTVYRGTAQYSTSVTGYDVAGRPLGTKVSLAESGFNQEYTTSQTWTSTGLEATRTLAGTRSPEAGHGGAYPEEISFGYDKVGNPVSMQGTFAYINGMVYNDHNEPTRYTYGVNNEVMWRTVQRGAFRRVTETTVDGNLASSQLDNTSYVYDRAGNILKSVNQQGNTTAPVQTQCYKYDELQQLIEAWSSKVTTCGTSSATNIGGPQPYWYQWSFRDDGSRAQQTKPAFGSRTLSQTDYTYPVAQSQDAPTDARRSRHQLLTANTGEAGQPDLSYTYNNDGSVATRKETGGASPGTMSFSYRRDGALDAVTSPKGTSTYIRDADGNILLRKDPESTTLYLPGQDVTVAKDSLQTDVARYYQFNGETVAVRDNIEAAKFVVQDHNGSTQVQIDAANNWGVKRRYLDPYGNTLKPASGTAADLVGERSFLDKPLNSTTSLVDLGARQYDSVVGRFLSLDPVLVLTDPKQAQGYAYAANNPVTFSDPSGLMLPTPGPSSTKTCDAKCHAIGDQVVAQYHANKFIAEHVTSSAASDCDWKCGLARKASAFADPAADFAEKAADVVVEVAEVTAKFTYDMTIRDGVEACLAGKIASCIFEVATQAPILKPVKYGKMGAKSWRGKNKMDDVGDAGTSRRVDDVDGLPCNCFVAGTKVQTPEGEKSIEDVKVGEKVWAKNLSTGKNEVRRVSGLFRKRADRVMTITVASGAQVTVTEEHPFYVAGIGWVMSAALRVGDGLVRRDGRSSGITAIDFEKVDTVVYNFEVSGDHNYYVTEAQLLVHNCPAGRGRAARMTSSEATDLANQLGYVKTNYRSNGQIVFKRGKLYITQDVDGHIGGTWKMARTPSGFNKQDRLGTYDRDLKMIGP